MLILAVVPSVSKEIYLQEQHRKHKQKWYFFFFFLNVLKNTLQMTV